MSLGKQPHGNTRVPPPPPHTPPGAARRVWDAHFLLLLGQMQLWPRAS